MSRPPRPHPARSTGGSRTDAQDRLDYLPLDYADFLDLQRQVAVQGLGRAPDQTGDVADTYQQLSALVGHVLAVYQRQFAREAFISTAVAPSSLVRHAHRLGTQPDPGLAASGYVVLVTKPGVFGVVPGGLPLASVPVGLQTTQDYETGDDLTVDAALNAVRPVHAVQPQVVGPGTQEMRVEGVGHGLAPGDELAVLLGVFWKAAVLDSVTELADRTATVIRLRAGLSQNEESEPGGTEFWTVLAHPALRVGSFGAGADPRLFPPSAIRTATATPSTGARRWWFTVSKPDGSAYDPADIYLSEKLDHPVGTDWVMRSVGDDLALFRIFEETVGSVVLNRAEDVDVTPQVLSLNPRADGGFDSVMSRATTRQFTTQSAHHSATVTVLRMGNLIGGTIHRQGNPAESTWSTDWQVRAALAATVPNPGPVTQPLVLPGVLTALAPGRPVLFADPEGAVAQVVRLRRVQVDEAAGTTSIEWDPLTAEPATQWTLDRLVVHGNVAPVSHGRTVHEKLTRSDGVAPFQRRTLREGPLTYLPGAAGAVPELEVRVAAVRWSLVSDFALSGPDDRHFRTLTAADASTTVVFGDGRTGAVPPAGAAIEAAYRVGRGVVGNIGVGRLSRVKRAHPLVDHVQNRTEISGGTEPPTTAEVRTQATRYLRTFDRAVSVADLADLALTMPGIARASARWYQGEGAVLVVATADGAAPGPLSAVRAFLDARRDTGVRLTLKTPTAHDIDVAVHVDPDPDWLPDLVAAAVRDTLTRRFSFPSEQLGAPGYLSEVYALVEALAGVVSARVTTFVTSDYTGVADAIRPDLTGWLRLQAQRLEVVVTGRPT